MGVGAGVGVGVGCGVGLGAGAGTGVGVRAPPLVPEALAMDFGVVEAGLGAVGVVVGLGTGVSAGSVVVPDGAFAVACEGACCTRAVSGLCPNAA